LTAVIVADAGPLIGLGKVGRLPLLQALYGMVLIPQRVHEELRVGSNLPGAVAAGRAIVEGWLLVRSVQDEVAVSRLVSLVDRGEAEAIVLAHESAARFLLVDDRRARDVARRRGIPVVGIGGVLLAAKRKGLIEAVGPLLDSLASAGYRLSPELRNTLRSLAGETES
jgi:predicted nucleic acid-binding protein